MPVRILCVGDMHLGRPVRVPDSLRTEFGIEPAELRPAEAWRRSVRLAISEGVDAVVILGDAVDQSNRFYEAQGPLIEGLNALSDAGIEVVGIAGNHDWDTLPRLAGQLPTFRLLGTGGRWEAAEFKCGMRVVGWSFPGRDVRQNPFDTFAEIKPSLGSSSTPVIGLLHCDLDVPVSTNAPVRSAELSDPIVSAWLLGHIHKPHLLNSMMRPIGYLGSISGLDPTETGPRGPWLLTVDGRNIRMSPAPLAPLRWETLDVDVTSLEFAADIHGAIGEAVTELSRRIVPAGPTTRAVGCRLRVLGRTHDTRAIAAEVASGSLVGSVRPINGVFYFIDDVDLSSLRPALDLDRIVDGTDPPAILAGLIRSIERGEPQGRELLSKAMEALQKETSSDPWIAAGFAPLDEAAAQELLQRAGMLALEELLAQRSGSAAPEVSTAFGEPI